MPGVREVMGLNAIRDWDLFLCHTCGMLIISHLSRYHFPLMTAVSLCLSEQMKLISFTFFKIMRRHKIMCNDSHCFVKTTGILSPSTAKLYQTKAAILRTSVH